MNPQPSYFEIQLAKGLLQTDDMTEQLNLDKINIDFEKYIADAKQKYKGKKLVVGDKIIHIE